MGGQGREGWIQWEQTKLGCIAMAKFVSGGTSINATSAEVLPPPPPPPQEPPSTFDSAGAKLDEKLKKELSELAKERDLQRAAGNSTMEQWRGLLDRAQCLFRALALPYNVCRLLRQAFALRHLRGRTTETVLARVLAKAQSVGYEAAVQELESLGVPSAPPPKTA